MEERAEHTIKRIAVVQMDNTYPDLAARLVLPRYGTVAVGSALDEAGYDVSVFVEHILLPDPTVLCGFDMLCFSVMSASANRTYVLIRRLRSEGSRAPIVIGGTHATYFPEDCLKHAGFVVRGGYGDAILPSLVQAINDDADVGQIAGLSYIEGGRVRHNPDASPPARFSGAVDYGLVEGYRSGTFRNLLRKGRVPLVCMQSSRGCDHKCAFCIAPRMFGRKNRVGNYSGCHRRASLEETLESWRRTANSYKGKTFFVDNQFVTSAPQGREESIAFLKAMIRADLGLRYTTEARLDVAEDPEMLSLLRESGCRGISFGFESVSQSCLDRYGKGQRSDDYIRRISNVSHAGIRASGSFMFGSDEDTLDTISADVDFALEHLHCAYFFVLGDYQAMSGQPGGLIPAERVFVKDWDRFNGFFVTHFPKHIPPSVLQQELIKAWRRFYSARRIASDFASGHVSRGVDRMGLRLTAKLFCQSLEDYLPQLRKLEAGKYDERGVLLENRLPCKITAANTSCTARSLERLAGMGHGSRGGQS